MEVSVRRRLYQEVWLPVPCVRGLGSCRHKNLCALLNQTCPQPWGDDRLIFKQDEEGLLMLSLPPPQVTAGHFQVQLKVRDFAGLAVLCLSMELELGHPQMSRPQSSVPDLKSSSKMLRFSWNNCGADSDPVKVNNLSISPDPITIPGDIQVSFNITSTADVTSPFPVDLDIKKKVAFWWVGVPCMEDVGSCDYSDFCSMLPETCPPSFVEHNIPCNCPAQKGTYALQDASISIPPIQIPSWLSSGDYQLTLNGKDPNGNRLLCIKLLVSLD